MNLARAVTNLTDRILRDTLFRATVTAISAGKAKIQRAGESADDTLWARLFSYDPAVDDEVICLRLGGGVIILGAIKRAAGTPWGAGGGDQTMTVFLSHHSHPGDSVPFELPNSTSGWEVNRLLSTERIAYTWCVPDNFSSLNSIEFVLFAEVTETIQADFNMAISAPGEAYNADEENKLNETLAVTADQLSEWDLMAVFATEGDIVAGDYVSFLINSDTSEFYAVGLKISYEIA